MNVMLQGEAAKYTGFSVRSLERYRAEGGGPVFVRLGERRLGYLKTDLDAWLNERRFPSRAAELAQQVST